MNSKILYLVAHDLLPENPTWNAHDIRAYTMGV